MIDPDTIVILKPNSTVYADGYLTQTDTIAVESRDGPSQPLQDVDADLPMSERFYTYHTPLTDIYVRVEDVLSSVTTPELTEEYR